VVRLSPSPPGRSPDVEPGWASAHGPMARSMGDGAGQFTLGRAFPGSSSAVSSSSRPPGGDSDAWVASWIRLARPGLSPSRPAATPPLAFFPLRRTGRAVPGFSLSCPPCVPSARVRHLASMSGAFERLSVAGVYQAMGFRLLPASCCSSQSSVHPSASFSFVLLSSLSCLSVSDSDFSLLVLMSFHSPYLLFSVPTPFTPSLSLSCFCFPDPSLSLVEREGSGKR
jgi:hypothetical protein